MLNDTLYRIRRIDGLQQLQRRGEGGRARADQLAPASRRRRHATSTRSPARKPSSSSRKAAARSPRPTRSWNLSRTQRVRRARQRGLPAARRAADGHGRIRRSRPSSFRRRRRPAATPTVIGPDGVEVNARGQGQLRARSAQRVRHRSARAAADGRRDVQPAGQLEQLPAAQARRQGRRAGARRGLLLPHLAAAGLRPAAAVHARRRVHHAHRARRRRRPAAVRLSPGRRRRRATSSTTCGRWPAPIASSRSTRIRRTRGSTRPDAGQGNGRHGDRAARRRRRDPHEGRRQAPRGRRRASPTAASARSKSR